MKTLELATDLTSNETNVTVSSNDEFNKMIKLVGKYNLYMITPFGWELVGTFEDMGNNLNDLF
jgi:hypothetical protein